MKSTEKAVNMMIGLIDLSLTVIAFLAAYFIRSQIFQTDNPLFGLLSYTWILLVFIPSMFISLYLFGFYDSKKTTRHLRFRLLKAFGICALISSSTVFLTRDDAFSRLLFFLFLGIDFCLLLAEKLVLRRFFTAKIRANAGATRVLAVGDPEKVKETMEKIRQEQDLIFHVVGYVSLTDESGLGNVEQLQELLIEHTVDQVFFFLPKDWAGNIEPYLQKCEELGITVRMLLDWYHLPLSKKELSYLGGAPMLTFHTVSLNQSQLLLKRAMDIFGGLCGVALTGLLSLIVAPIIKLTSSGPVFYSQERVGQNGRTFRIYKFRSMYADADQKLEELKEHNELSGAVFKMKNDPRVTPIGKFLRKTSMDEFPQFWNVLRGDMSLVGTRPPTVDEVAEYENYHRRRLSIKPGLTGMWQVSGRNDITDFEEIYKLDVQYIDRWSLTLDVKILFRTVWTVLTGKGAE